MNIEAELSRYKTCRDRNELEKAIQNYKDLALQHAANLSMAAQYSTVAQKLQEICNKLPAPHLIRYPTESAKVSKKTATISKEEHKKIDAAWEKKAKK